MVLLVTSGELPHEDGLTIVRRLQHELELESYRCECSVVEEHALEEKIQNALLSASCSSLFCFRVSSEANEEKSLISTRAELVPVSSVGGSAVSTDSVVDYLLHRTRYLLRRVKDPRIGCGDEGDTEHRSKIAKSIDFRKDFLDWIVTGKKQATSRWLPDEETMATKLEPDYAREISSEKKLEVGDVCFATTSSKSSYSVPHLIDSSLTIESTRDKRIWCSAGHEHRRLPSEGYLDLHLHPCLCGL